MKLGSKIVWGFVATNIIYLILSLFIFLSTQPVRKDSTTLSRDLLPMLDQASQVQYSTAMEGYLTQEYSHTIKAETWVEALTYNADVVKYLDLMENNVNSSPALRTGEITGALGDLRRNYQDFRDLAEELPSRLRIINTSIESVIYGQDKFNEALKMAIADEERTPSFTPGRNERLGQLRALENFGAALVISTMRARYAGEAGEFAHSHEMIQAAEAVVDQLAQGARTEAVAQMAASLKDLVAETKATVATLEENMSLAAEEAARRGQLADAVIRKAADLREAGDRRAQRVAADSTRTLENVILSLGLGVAVALGLSLILSFTITRGITRPVNALIDRLSGGALEVDRAAGDLTRASGTLAGGAQDSAHNLQDVSAALEELSSMTKRTAENSVEANTLMTQAPEAVARAEDSMGRVIAAMEDLSSSGNKIAKIIKTIDEIAFQTNLLALNAAVEAARAGEAGAGFAVVADEVRNLATRSAEAARNTADLIASTITNINSGSTMVNTTAENFKTVETHSSKVAQILGSVAEASREQSQGIIQINHSMTALDQVTQSNAHSADDSARAAGSLSDQAASLLSAVDDLTILVDGRTGNRTPREDGRVRRLNHSPKLLKS